MPESPRGGGTLQTRATLLQRLRDLQDNETWREFYELYRNFVYRHATGSGLSHHEAEEVIQEVFQACSKNIETYELKPQPGSFRRWLGNQARWRVTDKLRERNKPSSPHGRKISETEYDRGMGELEAPIDPETLRLEEEWRLELFETALKRLAKRVNPKHYQVFHLHNRDGWSLKQVSKELGISQTSAYVINHRLKSQLAIELKSITDAHQ